MEENKLSFEDAYKQLTELVKNGNWGTTTSRFCKLMKRNEA